MRKWLIASIAAASWWISACVDGPPNGPGRVDSNSNWLLYCASHGECGDLSCHCGVCTLPCNTDECAVLGEQATCATASDVDAVAASCGAPSDTTRMCMNACQDSDDCEAGRQCVLGSCMQRLTVLNVDGASDAEAPQLATSTCYLACRALANDSALLCLTTAAGSSDACIAAASAELEQCAAQCSWQAVESGPLPPDGVVTPPTTQDDPERNVALGAYHGYLCDPSLTDDRSGLIITIDDIPRADAVGHCEEMAVANPELSLWCMWNDEVILDACEKAAETSPGFALCGLFRGGFSEAEHMIASPDPQSVYVNNDAACYAFCRASGMQPGDQCLFGGSVIGVFSGENECVNACSVSTWPWLTQCVDDGNDRAECHVRYDALVASCINGC